MSEDRFVEAWLSPTLAPRTYRLTPIPGLEARAASGPYRLIRAESVGDAVYAWEESDDLTEILEAFVARNLPRPHEVCTVLDGHWFIIVGWTWTEKGIVWGGCQEAFERLERLHNPVDVAIWECSADALRRSEDAELALSEELPDA